jgi:hypothetical protein
MTRHWYTYRLMVSSGELTFSKRFGFLESGEDLGNMMYHTGRAMDYIGIVSPSVFSEEQLLNPQGRTSANSR